MQVKLEVNESLAGNVHFPGVIEGGVGAIGNTL